MSQDVDVSYVTILHTVTMRQKPLYKGLSEEIAVTNNSCHHFFLIAVESPLYTFKRAKIAMSGQIGKQHSVAYLEELRFLMLNHVLYQSPNYERLAAWFKGNIRRLSYFYFLSRLSLPF